MCIHQQDPNDKKPGTYEPEDLAEDEDEAGGADEDDSRGNHAD